MEEPKMPVHGFHRFPSFRRLLRGLTAGFLFLSVQILPCAFAQTELATVLGRVTDPSGAVVAGAEVEIRSIDTNLAVTSRTNGDGLYTLPSLHPGHYVISVRKAGFKTVSLTQLDLNVQDNVIRNFALQLGSAAESITVTADGEKINTSDASISTVVDRQFAENLPLNGRSFQALIQLTPGVVLTTSTNRDAGQFSVNGQRANANYWMVDGVSANIGISSNFVAGNGIGGALPSFGVQGGTNSLVSVDALQEFRILTSTFAPEFGRTPGGQISIVTRSGTDEFHGTAFEYLRNDVLDAANWFNGYTNNPPLPKPEERQNDFGGTLSGPIVRDRTFFFFSYEGLRLRLPQTALTTVPDLAARQNAISTMRPFFNAFPLPNGAEVLDANGQPTGAAQFNASFSNASSLDAYSLRLDHHLGEALSLFARYNYSPSALDQRSLPGQALSNVSDNRIRTQTTTAGATWLISPLASNDLRFNYSRTNGFGRILSDNFGGATPLTALPFPASFDSANAQFGLNILSLTNPTLGVGKIQGNVQRQINIVDNVSLQIRSHSLRFGVDYRRLSPIFDAQLYGQIPFFANVTSAESGNLEFGVIRSGRPGTLLLRNLGLFSQDTWRVSQAFTVTYGLRWDVDFSPAVLEGPSLLAVNAIDLNNLSSLALSAPGTPAFHTPYANFAPRLGIAYQLQANQSWGTVLRAGAGVFYDLATQEVGNGIQVGVYPYGATNLVFGGTFPFDFTTAASPPITVDSLARSGGVLFAFDPRLKLPYTAQWNLALEQSLGGPQTLSISYLGAAGRRLIQSGAVAKPNPSFASARLVLNSATSDYHALQVQFQRRLSHGLQVLSAYSLAHSIDTASAGSYFNSANTAVPGLDPNSNRGPSDFDIRNTLSAAVSYGIPVASSNALAAAIARGWSLQSVVQVRSAPPVNVFDSRFFRGLFNASTQIRPDLVPGQPLALHGSQNPGGMALNAAAFIDPPIDSNGNPVRQGNLGRNALRGFGAAEWDVAVHREFGIRESLKLQFRAEMFNILNHPNFGPPLSDLSNTTQFGKATKTLDQNLGGGNLGAGGFNPLYQIGGPRSIQLALKFLF
jgi:hypothetical protein